MKKFLLPILTFATLASADNLTNTLNQDPFKEVDKIFKMQMKQMELMQKQMDEIFKTLNKSNFNSNFPVIVSNSSLVSSGLKDKGDHYEMEIGVSKAAKTDVNVKAQNGMLTIKVTQTNNIENNSSNTFFKSNSSSSYMQSFTLPKDADGDKVSYDMKDNKIIIKIPKVKKNQ